MSSDKPSKLEGCGDGQPLPVLLFCFVFFIFMSFYCLFFKTKVDTTVVLTAAILFSRFSIIQLWQSG